jgi:uncharacterized membrane protein
MAVSTHSRMPDDFARRTAVRTAVDGYTINTLGVGDLREALRKGWADFMALPSHLIFLVAIYPVCAFLLAQLTYSFDLLPLFFPLVAGFAIVGPFVGLFMYEISRRREQGLDVQWRDALKVLDAPGRGSILLVGLLLFVIFALWMAAADRLWAVVMSDRSIESATGFLRSVLTTSEGWTLIVVGHAVGFFFAALAFMVSAVSFPMLLDRPAGAGEAIRASVLTVRRNPGVMAVWAAIIAAGLMAGSATLFVGLVIILPVLAHASWHLYRRAVVWDQPRKTA